MPLDNQKICVLYAITARRILGPMIFKRFLIQSGMSVTFFGHFITDLRKNRYIFILCKMVLHHILLIVPLFLKEVFEDRLISRRL
jgi:hypothetical protein